MNINKLLKLANSFYKLSQSEEAGQIDFEPTVEGNIRLYRAQKVQPDSAPKNDVPDWIKETPMYESRRNAAGRWFLDTEEGLDFYIDFYRQDGENTDILYLDLPIEEAEKYKVSNMPLKVKPEDVIESLSIEDNPRLYSELPDIEYFLPKEIASKAKKLKSYIFY